MMLEVERKVDLNMLLAKVPGLVQVQGGTAQVSGIVLDSRKVQPGSLFVALSGGQTDGHRYIPEAIRRGATAVVGTQPPNDLEVPYVQVDDGRQALAHLSAAFYDFPARRMVMIGVTGTDGKTTTSNLIYSVLRAAGLKAGMISTVNAVIGDDVLDTGFHVTTPEAPDVQYYLSRMAQAGLTHVVLEATSHGLAQHRVDACEFDIAVVTNITHEHLDYHGSYDEYFAAKARLFQSLGQTASKSLQVRRGAVLNQDDGSYDRLSTLVQDLQAQSPELQLLSYGRQAEADWRAEDVRLGPDGIAYTAVGRLNEREARMPIRCSLAGGYNVSNTLAAVSVGAGLLGLDSSAVQTGIAELPGVPGRMERIDLGQDFSAIVDFAHTPNALKSALEEAREMTEGRVIAVFGSAGLRDRQKRRMMAETSAELADLTVLTAEDPRTESLDQILEEMAEGARSRGGVEEETFWRVPDRGEAIRFALRLANEGDVVIACGKGHEQSMCFGETEYSWDDRTAMRAALCEFLGLPGPKMPFLPTVGE